MHHANRANQPEIAARWPLEKDIESLHAAALARPGRAAPDESRSPRPTSLNATIEAADGPDRRANALQIAEHRAQPLRAAGTNREIAAAEETMAGAASAARMEKEGGVTQLGRRKPRPDHG